VDSWERLGVAGGAIVQAVAWCRGCRCIATSHEAAGLPVLADCRPTPAVLRGDRRTPPRCWGMVWPDHRQAGPAQILERHGGDIREALFDLYDRFEARRRSVRMVRI